MKDITPSQTLISFCLIFWNEETLCMSLCQCQHKEINLCSSAECMIMGTHLYLERTGSDQETIIRWIITHTYFLKTFYTFIEGWMLLSSLKPLSFKKIRELK